MPTRIWRAIQYKVVCAKVESYCYRRKTAQIEGKESCQERFPAQSNVYIEISSMQRNSPDLGG